MKIAHFTCSMTNLTINLMARMDQGTLHFQLACIEHYPLVILYALEADILTTSVWCSGMSSDLNK